MYSRQLKIPGTDENFLRRHCVYIGVDPSLLFWTKTQRSKGGHSQ